MKNCQNECSYWLKIVYYAQCKQWAMVISPSNISVAAGHSWYEHIIVMFIYFFLCSILLFCSSLMDVFLCDVRVGALNGSNSQIPHIAHSLFAHSELRSFFFANFFIGIRGHNCAEQHSRLFENVVLNLLSLCQKPILYIWKAGPSVQSRYHFDWIAAIKSICCSSQNKWLLMGISSPK